MQGHERAELVAVWAHFFCLQDDLLCGHASLVSFLRARLHVFKPCEESCTRADRGCSEETVSSSCAGCTCMLPLTSC